MATASRSPRASAGPDDLDALFGEEANFDDTIFNTTDATNNTRSENNAANPVISGLGIDEEVQVQSKRRKIVKLDQDRLTSSAGIPKLQRIAKSRLKFRGKGHEFSDVAALLRTYQLWLDDLYPRAKFADGLAIMEKLGHTKSMQRLRRDWIDENRRAEDGAGKDSDPGNQFATANPGSKATQTDDEPDEDNLSRGVNFGPGKDTDRNAPDQQDSAGQKPSDETARAPDEDELDQLLAEEVDPASQSLVEDRNSSNSAAGHQTSTVLANMPSNEFEDEEEIMRDMGW